MENFEYDMINSLLEKGINLKTIQTHTGIPYATLCEISKSPEIRCTSVTVNKLVKYHCYLQTIDKKSSKKIGHLIPMIIN